MSKRTKIMLGALALAAAAAIGVGFSLFGGSSVISAELTSEDIAALSGYHARLSRFLTDPEKPEYSAPLKSDLAENISLYSRVFTGGENPLDPDDYYNACRQYASSLSADERDRACKKAYCGVDCMFELSGDMNRSFAPVFDMVKADVTVSQMGGVYYISNERYELTDVMIHGEWDEHYGEVILPQLSSSEPNVVEGEPRLVTVQLDSDAGLDLMYSQVWLSRYIGDADDESRLRWMDELMGGVESHKMLYGSDIEGSADDWQYTKAVMASAKEFIAGITEGERSREMDKIDSPALRAMTDVYYTLRYDENDWEMLEIELEICRDTLTDGREGHIDYISGDDFTIKRVMVDGRWTDDFDWTPRR